MQFLIMGFMINGFVITGFAVLLKKREIIIMTSRVTWKIHKLKYHLATLPEARTVTLSMIGHVQYSQPRWCRHASIGDA